MWLLQPHRFHQKGAVIMDPKVTIHNDFCSKKDQADIQAILSAVTELIAEVVVRTAAKPDGKEV